MRRAKILVIDDEKLILKGFQRELESAGYYVKGFASGKEAVEHFRKEPFDIIYVDLVMPEMNGVDICKEIKEISPKTELVLISGHPEEVFRFQTAFWHAGGRDEILRKPLLENELLDVTLKIEKELQVSGSLS